MWKKTPAWVDGVSESVKIAGAPGPGLAWREKCLLFDKKVEAEHTVTEWEEKKRAVISTKLPLGASMKRVLVFEGSRQRPQLTVEMSWNLGFAGAFLDEQRLRVFLEEGLKKSLLNWKNQIAVRDAGRGPS